MGHGHLARLRQEQDGVHHREHAEPLASARRARRRSMRAASTTTSWCSTSPACAASTSGSPRRSTSRSGVEARRESYSIFAGEPDSYRNGGVLLPNGTPAAPARRCSRASVPRTKSTRTAPRSARTSISKRTLTREVARIGRGARRALFGLRRQPVRASSPARYDFTRAFALRGSVQNGFRAPSLQQQFFPTTSTNFIGGVPFDITHVPGDRSGRASRSARSRSTRRSR